MFKLTYNFAKKLITKPIEGLNRLAVYKFPEEAIQIQLEDMDHELDIISQEYARTESERKVLDKELVEESDDEVKKSIEECIELLDTVLVEKRNQIKAIKSKIKKVKLQITKLQSKKRVLEIKKKTLEIKNSKFKSELGIKKKDTVIDVMSDTVSKLEERVRAYDVKLKD
jgi:chromosome segregation ATPase